MPDIQIEQLFYFAAFVLPGAISLLVHKLIECSKEDNLKEKIIEAVVYSMANIVLVFLPIKYLFENFTDNIIIIYFSILIALFVLPVIWPFLLIFVLKKMKKHKLIKPRMKTAWDHYFSNLSKGSYIIIHMNDGSFLGGKFDEKSYASGYPNTGDLYIEELWDINTEGNFTGDIFENQGLIVKSDQYRFIRVSN